MWNDIETSSDYLHFSVISQAVADMIVESGNQPISIGVSGLMHGFIKDMKMPEHHCYSQSLKYYLQR